MSEIIGKNRKLSKKVGKIEISVEIFIDLHRKPDFADISAEILEILFPGYQDQGQDGAFSQAGQVICYFCRQPGHFRWDCPRRPKSQGYGTPQSQSSVRRVRVSSQDGQMVCYHYQQPQHMRRDCPQRQGSQGFGTTQSQSAVGQERTRFVPPTSQTGHIGQGQSVGRGRAQDLQAESSGQAG